MRTTPVRHLHQQTLRLLAVALIAALCALAPTSLAAAGPASAGRSVRVSDIEMTREEAGDYYLRGACRNHRDQQRFYNAVWKGRDTISAPEVRRRLPEVKRQAGMFASSVHTWARHLYNPPAAWPADVARQVNELAAKNVRYETFRRQQARALTAAGWLKANGRANRVKFGALASTIRAKLDLPPSGRGC